MKERNKMFNPWKKNRDSINKINILSCTDRAGLHPSKAWGFTECLLGIEPIQHNLVGGIPTPLKNMKVSWGYYSQYMQK